MRKLLTKFGEFEFPIFIIDNKKDAAKAISSLLTAEGETWGLDLETTKKHGYNTAPKSGLCPLLSNIRLLQIYTGRAVLIFDIPETGLECLRELLYKKKWYAHYGVFEISHLSHAGFPDLDISCSMLMSQLIYTAEHSPFEPTPEEEDDLEENPDGMSKYRGKGHTLEDCTGRHFGISLDKTLQTSNWATALSTAQYQYAAADSVMTYHLARKLYKKIEQYKEEKHYSLIKQMQHVVADMHLRGFPVDWAEHTKFVNRWDEAQGKAHRECYGYFGNTNLNSTKQLGTWLEKHLKRSPEVLRRWPKTSGGKAGKPAYSFSHDAISPFSGLAAIKHLLEYKRYTKFLSTYGESWAAKRHPITNRIHTEYTLAHAVTGRLSARKPNMQQWPKGPSRAIFGPSKGLLVVADFSQIEIRVQAELSRDPVMKEIFQEGRDIYCEFGSSLYGKKITKEENPAERDMAKQALLSFAYGMGAATFCARASIPLERAVPIEEGVRVKDAYYKKFKRYIEWCKECRDKCSTLGYVRTKLGKMRKLEEKEIYTKGPNHEVQGTSAEIMCIAMIRMRKAKLKPIGSIHDEGLVECKKDDGEETIEKVNKAMNGAFEYIFPNAASLKVAEAKAGRNWLEAK